jgi:uncharacterized protein
MRNLSSVVKPIVPSDVVGCMRLLILQPTPFCNINCSYCYLPTRDDRRRMPFEIVEAAVRFAFESKLPGPDATICWHAGEPLVLPPAWYRAAFSHAAVAAPSGKALPHAFQTNAMLVNDAWCDLILENKVRLGVSIDGPAFLHDSCRRTRKGKGTHAAVMRGIEKLAWRNVPFHVITVISALTLDYPEELAAFYREHGILDVAFNIEEMEGVHVRSSLYDQNVEARFREFFRVFLRCALHGQPPIMLREWRDTIDMLAHPAYGQLIANSQNTPFAMVTVSSNGEVFTFSPELAGLKDGRYGDFSIGKLPNISISDALSSRTFRSMWSDIANGIDKCRGSCSYFDFCLGGAPANKLAERKTFDAEETFYCRLIQKCVADVVLTDLENRLPFTSFVSSRSSQSVTSLKVSQPSDEPSELPAHS